MGWIERLETRWPGSPFWRFRARTIHRERIEDPVNTEEDPTPAVLDDPTKRDPAMS